MGSSFLNSSVTNESFLTTFMLITVALLIVGFVILGLGAELMVRGSSSIALKFGVPPLVIGLTVVAFGTSAPELAVSVESALTGRSAIALGNVIGSNIANIGLILGIIALIQPIPIDRELMRRQMPLLIGVSLLLWFILLDTELNLVDGALLTAGLVGFLFYSYRKASSDTDAEDLLTSSPVVVKEAKSSVFYAVMVVIGLAMLVYGSTLFVESAVKLARILGIGEAVIGLTIVAVGTSLPELATSLVAAWKRETGLAVGNVIGSNLFNILGILGITALIQPISSQAFDLLDFIVMLSFSVVMIPMAVRHHQLSRFSGALMLTGYLLYMAHLFTTG